MSDSGKNAEDYVASPDEETLLVKKFFEKLPEKVRLRKGLICSSVVCFAFVTSIFANWVSIVSCCFSGTHDETLEALTILIEKEHRILVRPTMQSAAASGTYISTVDPEALAKAKDLSHNLNSEHKALKLVADATVEYEQFNYDEVLCLLHDNLSDDFDGVDLKTKCLAIRLRGLSFMQKLEWSAARDDFEHLAKLLPDDWLAKASFAACLLNLKDYESAVGIYDNLLTPRKLKQDANYHFNLANAYNNRGNAYQLLGNSESAIKNYQKCIQLIDKIENPKYESLITKAVALNNLGTLFVGTDISKKSATRKQVEESISYFTDAIAILLDRIETDLAPTNRNDLAMLYANRGIGHQKNQDHRSAEIDLQKSIDIRRQLVDDGLVELKPQLAQVLLNSAIRDMSVGDLGNAILKSSEAIDLLKMKKLSSVEEIWLTRAKSFRGKVLVLGNEESTVEGVKDFHAITLRLAPLYEKGEMSAELKEIYSDTLNNFAWHLATHYKEEFRDGKLAVQCSETACAIKNTWAFRDTLAAAYAENNEFDLALKTQQQAYDMLVHDYSTHVDTESATLNLIDERNDAFERDKKDLESRIFLYKDQKPFHSASPVVQNQYDAPQTPSEDLSVDGGNQ